MTYEEKLIHYATAPRVSAGVITQPVDGNLVSKWVGKLRGKFVSMDGEYKFDTREEALELARKYRQSCIDEALYKGLSVNLEERK